MNPTPITSKTEMYRRLNAGLLGNTLPAAETYYDADTFLSENPGPYALRLKTAGGNTIFNLTADQVWTKINEMPSGSWNLSGMLKDENRLVYGHLNDDVGGWHLHYSDTPGRPCKLWYAKDGCEQKNKQGLAARLFLRGIMDDVGWLTLVRLVEEYPDHCVEFTVLKNSVPLTLGWSNTIFWEVRHLGGLYEIGSKWYE